MAQSSSVSHSSSATLVSPEQRLLHLVGTHACARHALFDYLSSRRLTAAQVAALLKNYDAHASVLRRLLLKAATLMPEPAVGFVLENVRNEYGNGNYAGNHQAQLREVATMSGATAELWQSSIISPEIGEFIKRASELYFPQRTRVPGSRCLAAVAAGAITGTELMAIKEFEALQVAFDKFGLADHVWFNHVTIEAEHSDESLQLALYFINKQSSHENTHDLRADVEFGLTGILGANVYLYDGLLNALLRAESA
jgi:hypothetical protein